MKRYVSFVLLVASLLSCKKDGADQFFPTNEPSCFESSPAIRQAKDLVGRISKTQGQEPYSINYSVPGTYDSVWIGFACNLPDEYKTVGKEVVFSGTYRKGPEGVTSFAGAEIYYLYLTSIREK